MPLIFILAYVLIGALVFGLLEQLAPDKQARYDVDTDMSAAIGAFWPLAALAVALYGMLLAIGWVGMRLAGALLSIGRRRSVLDEQAPEARRRARGGR